MVLLLLLYPVEIPEIIPSISLAVVFFNALSRSGAYPVIGRLSQKIQTDWIIRSLALALVTVRFLNVALQGKGSQ